MSKLTEAQCDVTDTADLIGMIFPGIQTSINTLVSRNSKFFAYSTVISVYVYEQMTMKLVNIITTGKDSITTISFAQKSPNVIAISFGCNRVEIIDVVENQQISQFVAPEQVVSFGWSNQDTNIICFTKYYCQYTLYDVNTGNKIKTYGGNFGNIRVLAVSEAEDPIYFGGNNNGAVTRIHHGNHSTIEYPNRGKVVAAAIDPNCSTNCLIVWKQSWGIYDISDGIHLVHDVKELSYAMASATWSSFIPGQFFTGDEVSGIVRIWNASSSSPLEVLNVHSFGVTSLLDLKHNRLLLGFADGMIGVYDLENRKFLFQNVAGHSNTIFTLLFHPITPDVFISSGGEGSICTWNASTMQQMDRLIPPESLGGLFSMDVSPGGGMICCGYSKGLIAFFSLQTKAKIFDFKICSQRIISLSFSHFEPELVLASSDGGFSCVFDMQKRQIVWKAPVKYSSNIGKFSPHFKGQMLIATHDGSVHIYNGFESEPSIKLDDPMKSDLYFIAFSPTNKDVFISSDNSGFVKLWHLSNRSVEIIGQHKGKSRPVCFHPQLEHIVASSGYDSNIMIHDLRAKQVICSFTGHPSIIYSLAFSPSNPHLLISAAADSSIKFWSIDKLITKTFLHHILKSEIDWIRPLEGFQQLLKLAKRCMKIGDDKIKFSQSDVPHINDIVRLTKKIVKRSMSGALKETRLIKRALKSKERMTNSAKLELFMGNPKHFCELMFTTGDFDMAVAASPAVSVNFWREMMKNRAKLFENENDIANYQLIIGDVDGAIETLIKADEINKAFLVSAAMRKETFKFDITSSKITIEPKSRPYIDTEFTDPTAFIEYLAASERASQCLKEGQVYLAASAFLSIGDVLSAEMCLLKHGQNASAYLLDLLTKTNYAPVKEKFYMLCIQSGSKKELFKYLNAEEKEKFAIALSFKTPEKKEQFYSENGLNSIKEYQDKVQKSKTDLEKLHNLLLSGNLDKACEFMISTAQNKTKTNYPEVEEMVKLIEIADLSKAKDTNIYSIAFLSMYFGFYRAIWKGYTKIIKYMQTKITNIASSHKLDWAKSFVEDTKKALSLFDKNKDNCRIYYVGYQYLNAKPIGYPYSQSTMYGKQYYLEDGITTLGMEEALMWFECTPYSPLTFQARHYVI